MLYFNNKGGNSMKQFTLNVAKIKAFSKPDSKQASGMKQVSNNSVETLTIGEFQQSIEEGYSFHPGVFNHKQNTVVQRDWIQQEMFVADIDHGNLSLETLNSLIDDSPVEMRPAMIYESHSSSAEMKKYRVIFISDKVITDAETAKLIQKYLVLLFGKPYMEQMKVDYNVVNLDRLFYGTSADKILHVEDVVFNSDVLIEFCQNNLIEEEYLNLKIVNAPFHARSKNPKKEVVPKKEKKSSTTKKRTAVSDFDSLIKDVEANLKQMAKTHKLGRVVDYTQAYNFINDLPLTEVLGWEFAELNCCIFHDDSNPSAHIIEVNGQQVYKCFGCFDEGEVYNTFEVLKRLFARRYKDTIKRTKERIFELLGVRLGSDYQRNAVEELRYAFNYIGKLDEEGHPVAKRLVKDKLFGFYRQMLNIAENRITSFPLTKGLEEECATFYVSYSYISKWCMREGFTGCSNKSRVEKKINDLVKLGLIEKISIFNIQDAFAKRTQQEQKKKAKWFIDKMTKEEVQEAMIFYNVKSEADLLEIATSKVKHVTYYRIPYLTVELLDRAEQIIKHDKDYRVLKSGRSNKQATMTYGAEFAKGMYQQSEMELTFLDTKFLYLADQAIDKLIAEQGYFTEKQLLAKVDRKGAYFKKETRSLKKKACDRFLPYLAKTKDLIVDTVNKDTRPKFAISDKIKSNTRIYVKKK